MVAPVGNVGLIAEQAGDGMSGVIRIVGVVLVTNTVLLTKIVYALFKVVSAPVRFKT